MIKCFGVIQHYLSFFPNAKVIFREDIQWFEYGTYFIRSTSENIQKTFLTSESNSLFIVKNIAFSVYYILFGFLNMFL